MVIDLREHYTNGMAYMNLSPVRYEPLRNSVRTDVVVIGAGIVGLTTALLLKRAGMKVAVLEAGYIGVGASGQGIGAATVHHDVVYERVLARYGLVRALQYAALNQKALTQIDSWINEYEMACDYEHMPAFLCAYGMTDHVLTGELKVCRRLGMRVVYQSNPSDNPFRHGALLFDKQLHMNLLSYLQSLAKAIVNSGSHIYESTRVLRVKEGSNNTVISRDGAVTASHVVVATNYPIYDPVLIGERLIPYQSHVVTVRVRRPTARRMLFALERGGIRISPGPSGYPDSIFIAGEMHRTGEGGEADLHYNELQKFATDRYDVLSFGPRWCVQDSYTDDRLPFVGRISADGRNIFGATGMSGCGMIHGTAAGIVMSDLILGLHHISADLFSTQRSHGLRRASEFIAHSIYEARRFIGPRLESTESFDPSHLAPGEGKIVEINGTKIAIYRDPQGQVHSVSALCTHMGCGLWFNRTEVTWDCSCHGSRFDPDGNVISGPATRDLRHEDIE